MWALGVSPPQAHFIVGAATCKEFTVGVPLDLFDLEGVATLPNLHRVLGSLDVPQIDVLALASDCNMTLILPVNFDALQLRIQLRVHKFGDVLF